ncbi:HAD family hydrolase [Streptomyces sp. NBC_00557]|uniref:HAD family hydrolase n=1 Tax=Streptomyces sp. NBC_00557 TaxID=2975776 RepID=UPI002E800360|nr:haloacid dehalogenase-like hydrolase [Streptomyces sp. NBC_00557]WUC33389.1 haloacid dehalogenase-like hydrolase [Streptomyces sp. NBC_00557]
MKQLFVWDLHGTLEQGNDRAVVDVSNRVLERHGYQERFTYEDGMKLYGSKWYEYFQWLLPQESYPTWSRLQDDCFDLSQSDITLQCRWLQPSDYALDVLRSIAQHADWDQILISNTRAANLKIFIDALGIAPFFPEGSRYAVDGHAAQERATKKGVLRDHLKNRHYDRLVFIGDSPSDMRLKEVAGGTSYLYAHADFPFRKCEADYRIRDLRAILEPRN